MPTDLRAEAIIERRSPKIGGRMALYGDFLVHRANIFSKLRRVPYTAITRVGVQAFRRLPVPQAHICVEYHGEDGRGHLAQLVCSHPDEFLAVLQEKVGVIQEG